jgi:hypothetical protein
MPIFQEQGKKSLTLSKLPPDLLLQVPRASFMNFLSAVNDTKEDVACEEMVNLHRASTFL